ncbi:MAG TPA: hypothetical protein VL049_09675, partial [Candidatus Dormibacteraeota bacterium]|nr:hypothetical protein [Candidatus Dormibacteraeota bacterium]
MLGAVRVSPLHADLVIRGGKVITVDAASTIAEAVAVRDGIIVAVGTAADIAGRVGPATRVIDGRERAVVPGFIDSHTHNVHVGEFRYSFRQINAAAELNPALPDLLGKVRERAATL